MKRLLRLWRPERRRREVDEEIERHLELRAAELERRGFTPEEATAEARRRFGGDEGIEAVRASAARRDRKLTLSDRCSDLRQDLVLALRRAVRQPVSTAAELLILTLAVALLTGTVTLVDRVLLRPLPFPEAERLVSLWSVGEEGDAFPWVSMSNWADWNDAAAIEASGLFAQSDMSVTLEDDVPRRISAYDVAGGFFSALRMPLLSGRWPSEDEVEVGASVALVEESFWRSRMSAAELPAQIEIGDRRVDVIGVARRDAAYPSGAQLWRVRPVRRMAGRARNSINWNAVARLGPGVTTGAAKAELDGIAAAIRESDPAAIYSWGVGIVPFADFVTDDARSPLLLLLAGALGVLLVAGANVAALNVARATARVGEGAVRRALGAGRARLIRHELTGHLLVIAMAAVLGIGIAALGIELSVRKIDLPLPRSGEIGLDVRAGLLGAAVVGLVGLASAMLPALFTSNSATPTGSRAEVTSRRGVVVGRALVVFEVVLAVVLLSAGGALLRDYRTVLTRDLGFEPRGVVTAEVALTSEAYRDAVDPRMEWWDEALRRVSRIPGVAAAGIANRSTTDHRPNGFVLAEGESEPSGGAIYAAIGGAYLEAMGIPLISGRAFDAGDGPDTERVVLVSEVLADRYWPGESALGKRIQALSMEGFGADQAPWLGVVGVVGSTRAWGYQADEIPPEMYVLAEQIPVWMGTAAVVARAESQESDILGPVGEEVRAVDGDLAVETRLLTADLAEPLAQHQALTLLLGGFAVIAVLLASVGIYSILRFQIGLRRRELGLRAALGASGTDLVGMVLRDALLLAGLGATLGTVLAILTGGLLRTSLYALSPTDPITLAATAASLLLIAVVAASEPALRAARMDPNDALRRA
ncbi:MAG: FtsX-like permease family protein [Longimicrobiales bacterium]|nr:FtsX-like permease family protein [Longimicrobiales bacterium]